MHNHRLFLFSFDLPRRAQPARYRVSFPGKSVLQFDYHVIQLNRLHWRKFVRLENPVASALMAKYETEIVKLTAIERTETMGLVSSWEQKGIDQGISQGILRGKEDLLLRQVTRRFGSPSADFQHQLDRLTPAQMDELGETLFDYRSLPDLQR